MYLPEICQKVKEKFPDVTVTPLPEKYIRDPEPQIHVPANHIVPVCLYLRDNEDMLFDLPNQMTAVDYIKDKTIELVYYLYSSKKHQAIVVKSRVDRDKPEIDSVTPVWSGMDWQEREVFDLFGVQFKGHPNPKRIMLWEGYPGHPLRKDYVHVTDRYDSGLEVGTPGLDAKGVPIKTGETGHGA